MRREMLFSKSWRRQHEWRRKACGPIQHPSLRGSTGKPDVGRRSTYQTSCLWTWKLNAVRLLAAHHSLVRFNLIPRLTLHLFLTPSSAIDAAIATTVLIAPTASRLRGTIMRSVVPHLNCGQVA
jgi:hypothetical protein